MTPELEAALAFSDMMGIDKHYLGGPAVNEAIVVLAAEVRRNEGLVDLLRDIAKCRLGHPVPCELDDLVISHGLWDRIQKECKR